MIFFNTLKYKVTYKMEIKNHKTNRLKTKVSKYFPQKTLEGAKKCVLKLKKDASPGSLNTGSVI